MKLIPNNVSRTFGRQLLQAKKHSPHIFFAAGLVGVVGSTVLACRATLKLEKTVDEIHKDVQNVKETYVVSQEDSVVSHKTGIEYKKDMIYVYSKGAVRMGRLYGPSLVLGAASIGALTGSHVQLTRRNSALMATVSVLSKAFEDYRIRMQQELGEERELEIYRGIEKKTVEENGKKKTVKILNDQGLSPYARVFDDVNSRYWRPSAEYNRFFLESQQRYANELLHSRGHVFLNEIYDNLGFEHTPAGSVVGWLRKGDGDGYIDFNLFELSARSFQLGYEQSIWLDFNVDGVIYEQI